MNDQQRAAIAARQRKTVAEQLNKTAPEGPPPEPPAPQEPFDEIVAREQERVRGQAGGVSLRVTYLRFIDKSFQLPGMQSGEQLSAGKKSNGQEHQIELVSIAGVGCFLVWWIDPPKREIKHEFVERSAVKTWRLA